MCKFRHLLEEHRLGEKILGTVNLHLQARGVRITTGTIVDATILHAPTSTRTESSSAIREMHQDQERQAVVFRDEGACRSGQQDQDHPYGSSHAAHVADSRVLPDLLHGEETRVWGDQALSRTN